MKCACGHDAMVHGTMTEKCGECKCQKYVFADKVPQLSGVRDKLGKLFYNWLDMIPSQKVKALEDITREYKAEFRRLNGETTCCRMRVKTIVACIGTMPEAQCGIPDSTCAEFIDFGLQAPDGSKKAVLRMRYCPWCGARTDGDEPVRIVDLQSKDPDEESDESWKSNP